MGTKRKPQVVDTNVILRFLVGDNKSQQRQARTWFLEAQEGKRKLVIKPLVVAETCFVLESFYRQKREEIAGAFEVFLAQRWLEVADRKTMLSLWQWYREGLHFVDSFLLAWAKENEGEILTFDRQIKKCRQVV
jgi:predicted nucleic acid-binding protein